MWQRKVFLMAAVMVLASACVESNDPELARSSSGPESAGDSRNQGRHAASRTDPGKTAVLSAPSVAEEAPQEMAPASAPVAEFALIQAPASPPDQASPKRKRQSQATATLREVQLASSHMGIRVPSETLDRERYGHLDGNPVKLVSEHPVSTYSIDADTGGYANVRRLLNTGRLPPEDAVRIEELINYFSYDYRPPAEREAPFRVTTTLAPAPWHAGRHLLRIGIQGYELAPAELAPANLVFLIDVSGSMRSQDKLPLLKSAMTLLARQLRPVDRVSIAVYAGASGVVLEPTPGDQTAIIVSALDRLRAGGSTNGGAGIRLAYALAKQSHIDGGINRILIATDGDFNVGTVNFERLKDLVESERDNGVSLTTLGFGTGNFNEHLMEQLADAGNGNYAYIDSLTEANKVLVGEMAGTLATIAKDVKVQIEFNPNRVAEYRLIGYENRLLKREDFNNDRVDAGEIGAGHSVTALYELTFVGSRAARVDPLRYGSPSSKQTQLSDELAFLRVRYKAPEGDESQLLEWPLARNDVLDNVAKTDDDFRFAAAVAGFGQLLRGGRYTERFDYEDVLELARGARGRDASGYRGQFLHLVKLAQTLSSAQTRSNRAPQAIAQQ